jgi:hypothetical protein
MLHVVGWQRTYKTVLQQAFFFILWEFDHFLVFVSENLENGPSVSRNVVSLKQVILDILKNWEFYTEMQTSPSDKMPPPPNKVKIIKQKKNTGLGKISKIFEILKTLSKGILSLDKFAF